MIRPISLALLPLALLPAWASAQPSAQPPQPAERWQGLRPRAPAAPVKAKAKPVAAPDLLMPHSPAPILDDPPPASSPATAAPAPEAPPPAPADGGLPVPSARTPFSSARPPATPGNLEWPNPRPGYAATYPPPRTMTAAELDQLLAQDGPTGEGRGWFFRGHAGPSFTHIGLENAEHATIVSGWGAGLGMSAGVWLGPRLVGSMELYTATHLGVQVVGDAITPPLDSATATLLAGGLSVTYVLGEHQAGDGYSVTGALLLTRTRIVEQPSSQLMSGSNLGPTLQVGLTREWSVVTGWGIGTAVRLSMGAAGDDERNVDYTTFASSLSFSFSYD